MNSSGDFVRNLLAICCTAAALGSSGMPACADTSQVAKKTTPAKSAPAAKTATPAASAKPAPAAKVAAGKPTVIDFGAGWCVPCKVFKPVYDKVKGNLGAQAEFQSVDTETPDGEKLANKYSVSGLPTVIILDHAGKVVFKKSGIMDEKTLTAEVTKAIGK